MVGLTEPVGCGLDAQTHFHSQVTSSKLNREPAHHAYGLVLSVDTCTSAASTGVRCAQRSVDAGLMPYLHQQPPSSWLSFLSGNCSRALYCLIRQSPCQVNKNFLPS